MSQDHVLPYCASVKHSEDTLFFVAEEDFRLLPEHEFPLQTFVKGAGGIPPPPPGRPPQGSAAASSAAAAADPTDWQMLDQPPPPPLPGPGEPFAPDPPSGGEPFAPPEGTAEEAYPVLQPAYDGQHYARLTKPHKARSKWADTLEDCVRLCTACHRAGHGDIIWLSWRGQCDKLKHPSNGSTLLAITVQGARALIQAMQTTDEPYHFDIWLKDEIVKGLPLNVGSSYVYPSIGAHCSHESRSGEPGSWHRPGDWEKPWVGNGTQGRNGLFTIGRFNKKQNWNPICDVTCSDLFSTDKFRWMTLRPAPDPAEEEASASQEQNARFVPGLRAAAAPASPPTTKRQKRAQRAHLTTLAFREWTDDLQEAGRDRSCNIVIGAT